jgi:hypothetical protein
MVKILPRKEPPQRDSNTTDGSLWMVKILPTESRRKSEAMEA